MRRTLPRSSQARAALDLVEGLQRRFAAVLEAASARAGAPLALARVAWLRDDGRHGGGERLGCAGERIFDRATLNVSAVHYDDDPERPLFSATALSCIVHPRHPRAPSIHVHESWTELRGGKGYWRMMADLNPALPNEAHTRRFARALSEAAPEQLAEGRAQGDRYFEIPALGRHRGVCHFYLEGYASDDFEADRELARRLGEAVIDCYAELLGEVLSSAGKPDEAERAAQLAYHTLYLLQVLTLDRGTTSGLLVHDQNDLGIMGSLPGHVDRELLAAWASRLPAPQDALLRDIVAVLPAATPCPVSDETRAELARVLRAHYRAHPEALELQARGDVIPPTVANHARG